MQLLPILEVAISLALLYLLFSQIVSSVHELLVSFFGSRGKYLRQWLNQALNDPKNKNWGELLYLHPTVDTLARKAGRPPAYIPSELFAKGLIDLVIDEAREHKFITNPTSGDIHYEVILPAVATPVVAAPVAGPQQLSDPQPLADFKAGLARLEEGDFKSLMRALLQDAEASGANTFDKLHQNLVGWYNDYMDRITGWYKQRVRWRLFWLGLVLAVAANLDSFHIAHYFWTHAAARQRVAAYAEEVVQRGKPTDPNPVPVTKAQRAADSLAAAAPGTELQRYRRQVDSLTNELRGLGFPIGWAQTTKPDTTRTRNSAALPDTFIVALPAQAQTRLQKDGRLEFWRRKGQWLRYVRDSTESAQANPLALATTTWRPPDILATVPPKEKRYLLALDPAQAKFLVQMAGPPPLKRALADQYPAPPAAAPLAEVFPPKGWDLLWHVPGWLLTAFALCLGGPFWFELLQRFVNVRNVGPKPAANNTPPVNVANRA